MLNWYRIERILGRGGFGVIYLATDTNLDHLVAVKEYAPSDIAARSSDSTSVQPLTQEDSNLFHWGMERFLKEARNLVKFKHPNIVRVMSVFQQNNTAYMVMEFEEGMDLRSYLQTSDGHSESSLKRLILPISKGLAEVHSHGFIHRDIKPANILVRNNGSPVLLDFGSARSANRFTQHDLTALVSVGYAPMEQYSSEDGDQQGPWTDIYALGGTLYFAVSGVDPIESTRRGAALFNGGKDPLISAENLGEGRYSRPFLQAIDWALQFRIADRPQTLEQWMPALLTNGDKQTPSRLNLTHKERVQPKFAEDEAETLIAVRPQHSHRPTVTHLSNPLTRSDRKRRKIKKSLWNGFTWSAAVALLLSIAAVGIWYASSRGSEQEKNNNNNSDAMSTAPNRNPSGTTTATHVNQAPSTAAGASTAQPAAATAAPTVTNSTPEPNTTKADLAAAQKAAEKLEAQKAAEKQAAEQQKKNELEEKQRKAREATEAAKKRAAQQARNAAASQRRRLNRALDAAQNALAAEDVTTAKKQLSIAQSIDSNNAEFKQIVEAVEAYEKEMRRPVSDEDFDIVARRFDGLHRAIESGDKEAIDKFAIASDQSVLLKVLMDRFMTIDVSIENIQVHNVNKSISADLRINYMVRENGDRATPSDAYQVRPISSKRISKGWSKIQW